jgi:hypothetical protein
VASDQVTWRKPRSITIVIAWGITNASIVLNAFLSGGQIGGSTGLEWYYLLLLFSVSVFAGALLVDVKTIVLGVFESLFISVLFVYLGMILPVLLGNVAGFGQANLVYWAAIGLIFKVFFPLGILTFVLGGMVGGFAEDLLF